MNKKIVIELLLLIILLDAILIFQHLTGMVTSSATVTIITQPEGPVYENNINDTVFHISLVANNSWFSYNASIHGGFDYSDNITQTFTIMNLGSTSIDILLSASDFDSEGGFIDVNQTNGDFQVYLPQVDEWFYVPDNSEDDSDGTKNTKELCVANSLPIGERIEGIDFRVRTQDATIGNYTAIIRFTSYNDETTNPCTAVGIYVIS